MTGTSGKFDEIDVAADDRRDARPSCKTRVADALRGETVDVRTGRRRRDQQSKDIQRQPRLPADRSCSSSPASRCSSARFIIFNTFSITVAQRTREFALLRTLGASRAQVLRSVVGRGAVARLSARPSIGLLGGLRSRRA